MILATTILQKHVPTDVPLTIPTVRPSVRSVTPITATTERHNLALMVVLLTTLTAHLNVRHVNLKDHAPIMVTVLP